MSIMTDLLWQLSNNVYVYEGYRIMMKLGLHQSSLYYEIIITTERYEYFEGRPKKNGDVSRV